MYVNLGGLDIIMDDEAVLRGQHRSTDGLRISLPQLFWLCCLFDAGFVIMTLRFHFLHKTLHIMSIGIIYSLIMLEVLDLFASIVCFIIEINGYNLTSQELKRSIVKLITNYFLNHLINGRAYYMKVLIFLKGFWIRSIIEPLLFE
ncbi:hypothetical protein ACJX0J_016436, partial [Zea mays]